VRLLDRRGAAYERQVGAQPLFGGVDGHAQRVERLEYLDPDRTHLVGVGPIGRRTTRGVHADLAGRGCAAVGDHAERRVDHVTVRVEAHRRREEETGVPRVAVEEVAVVVVDVARGRLGDRT
jgi:hypothetical protein